MYARNSLTNFQLPIPRTNYSAVYLRRVPNADYLQLRTVSLIIELDPRRSSINVSLARISYRSATGDSLSSLDNLSPLRMLPKRRDSDDLKKPLFKPPTEYKISLTPRVILMRRSEK